MTIEVGGQVEPGFEGVRDAFAHNFVEHGTLGGTVRWISEGAFSQDDNGSPAEPYYKVRIALSKVDLHNVPPGFRLVPGMTLSADIHIGSRSLFWFMMRGIIRGLDESMRGP